MIAITHYHKNYFISVFTLFILSQKDFTISHKSNHILLQVHKANQAKKSIQLLKSNQKYGAKEYEAISHRMKLNATLIDTAYFQATFLYAGLINSIIEVIIVEIITNIKTNVAIILCLFLNKIFYWVENYTTTKIYVSYFIFNNETT